MIVSKSFIAKDAVSLLKFLFAQNYYIQSIIAILSLILMNVWVSDTPPLFK
jgi:hypothetical protein